MVDTMMMETAHIQDTILIFRYVVPQSEFNIISF